MKKKCVFAGTFDPPTLGHKDIVLKCLTLFDEVIVAVLINPNKAPLFTEEARLAMLRKVFAPYPNVRVLAYDGLTVDLLRREGARFYVRGIRNGTDYDYEAQLNYINMDMYKEMSTVFLPTRQEYLRKHRMQSRERYKALKDGTRKVGEPFQIVCKCCGKTFESKMSNAMFCDQNCRSKYYRQEAAKKRKRECTCGNCGTVFITDRNGVKYCCEDCMKEAAYKRQKERRAAKKNEQKSIEASAIKESDQKGKTA